MWCEMQYPRLTRWVYCWAVLIISSVLLIGCPQLQYYGGLSGIVAAQIGLATHAAWSTGNKSERAVLTTLLLLFVAKIVYEYATGNCLFADNGEVPSLPLAHVLGLLSGLLLPMRPYLLNSGMKLKPILCKC
jgi:hypothetical protein